MKCLHCQSELKRGTATFTDSRNVMSLHYRISPLGFVYSAASLCLMPMLYPAFKIYFGQ